MWGEIQYGVISLSATLSDHFKSAFPWTSRRHKITGRSLSFPSSFYLSSTVNVPASRRRAQLRFVSRHDFSRPDIGQPKLGFIDPCITNVLRDNFKPIARNAGERW
jgi:hypothetical protein